LRQALQITMSVPHDSMASTIDRVCGILRQAAAVFVADRA
jgi:hypothetical protein